MRQFQVVGDVMGDVMGEDEDGNLIVAGPRRVIANRSGAGGMVRVQQPGWRAGQLAPGVQAPDEGVFPIALRGEGGVETFTAARQAITFSTIPQKPFRLERLLVNVTRTGTSATGRVLGKIFSGTDLQQASIQDLDLESLGQPNAFGVRLTGKPAQPGVELSIVTRLSSPLTGTDTIYFNVQILGRVVA